MTMNHKLSLIMVYLFPNSVHVIYSYNKLVRVEILSKN